MKTKLLLCAVGFASFLFAEKAQSQTLVTTFVEINPSVPVYGSINGGYFLDIPSGVSVFTDFASFCVDPTQSLSYGQSVIYEIQDPASLVNATLVAKLMGGYLSSSMTALDAAAVQWAIWEVVAELSPTKSLSSGNIVIAPADAEDTAVRSLAETYLQNIDSFQPVEFTYLTNDEHQDVVAYGVVPEPTTLALSTLSAFLLIRRRR
jgi:hypothetical protein